MEVTKPPQIPLPKSWTKHAQVAMLHVVALAQYVTAYTRSWSANSLNGRVRLKAENERLQQEIALLQEEIRIKDARMMLISPQHRPHYPPVERMSISELRAARGWSLQQTADVFLVTAATIVSWTKRLDEEGPDTLVQLRKRSISSPISSDTQFNGSRHCVPPWARSRSPRCSAELACISDRPPSVVCSKNFLRQRL